MRGEHSKVKYTKQREEIQKEIRRSGKPEMWRANGLNLTEEEVREAMKNSRSNKEAARWLDISFLTYKRYAETFIDLDTGKSLYEVHKNKQGVGIPRKGSGRPIKIEKYTDEELRENQVYSSSALARLKATMMETGKLGYTCACCGYAEKRVTDMKVPLLLNFKNGKKSDWRIENLRWVCYNCSFLLGLDYFSNSLTQKIESLVPTELKDMNVVDQVQKFYDMDDILLGQFKKLGLDNIEDPKPKEAPTQDLSDLIDYI
jgi:hypothetical protein